MNRGDVAVTMRSGDRIGVEVQRPSVVRVAGGLTGNGFPDVEVPDEVPIGTIYTDQDATNGASVWVSIGPWEWRVLWGDTGKRDLTSLLINGWTGRPLAAVVIRRVNDTVWLWLEVNSAAATSDTFMPGNLGGDSEGWFSWGGSTTMLTEAAPRETVRFSPSFFSAALAPFQLQRPSSGGFISGAASWLAAGTWPTFMPGVAA